MLWEDTELSFWMFARDEIPQDILDGSPEPESWNSPIARWTDQSCDIQNSFRDMQSMPPPPSPCRFPLNATLRIVFIVVINITICGDWAGPAYDNGGFQGTCTDAVADPSNYDSKGLSPPPVVVLLNIAP